MGAAILTSDGKVYQGCNVENSSYGLSICAERVAAVKAVSAGSTGIRAVAVTANLEGLTYPCGACRQFLAEFSDDAKVILAPPAGKPEVFELKELIPGAFLLKGRSGAPTGDRPAPP